MSIDDLSDRDLDAAVGREVLGLPVEAVANARTGGKDYVYAPRPGAPDRVRVPRYSGGSLTPALSVEVALQDRGWKRASPSREGAVVLEHRDGRRVEAVGPVDGIALCRAALKAMQTVTVL